MNIRKANTKILQKVKKRPSKWPPLSRSSFTHLSIDYEIRFILIKEAGQLGAEQHVDRRNASNQSFFFNFFRNMRSLAKKKFFGRD